MISKETNMIPGYVVDREIFRGRKRIVYRGLRNEDQKPVILKTLADDLPESSHLAALKWEFEILKNLRLSRIPKAEALVKYGQGLALVLEDTGGEPLRNLLDSEIPIPNAPFIRKNSSDPLNITAFLKVAIELSTAIAELHQNNIIHKDINPKNILLKPETLEVELIDFSISSRLPQEDQKISHLNILEGTLAYISPEQTGRMNRSMDYRTDFYSLGVTFYEMITSHLPFFSPDPLELIHWHIARNPQPPIEINPEIPKTISDIVMKLLSKTAESRYNSGFGLKADLELCLRQMKANGKIQIFTPGKQDVSDRLNIPQKLYGREKEIETLMRAFDRVCQGTAELMLVFGYSGIGKTSLIHEIHKPIVQQKGYFISGKFDQLDRAVPYSALIQAFQELTRQLLTESSEGIRSWKDKLLEALGFNGQIIIDVIPEVELIIGKQPAVPQLGPTESQNRFNLVFQRFINVFANSKHPLVIFLDDLQWVDSATLKLLETLTVNPDMQYLFMIGAYRDNEVAPGHPLILSLAGMKRAGANMSHISLSPLGQDDLNQFVADTLNLQIGKSAPLSELLMQKTGGNPFFVTQFLKSLHQENLIQFYRTNNQWQFDLPLIQSRQMTDNVVELMANRIQKLSEPAQRVLRLAACIGNRFDLNTLSIVNEKTLQETASDLQQPIQEGLILPTGPGSDFAYVDVYEISNDLTFTFKFLHDRVQQAAYDLIPQDRKKQVHLKVGQLLLSKSSKAELDEKLFDIVNQLNVGIDLIPDQASRREVAELNLSAGKKAKSSAAYDTGSSYLQVALSLLNEYSWISDYDFTFAVCLELAECEYLCGRFDEAEYYLTLLLQKARTRLDKGKVYNLKILHCESTSRYEDAIRIGHEAVELFGASFPSRPEEKRLVLEAELTRIQALMGDRKIETLIDLPAMQDPGIRMLMQLLTNLHTSSYLSADETLTLLNTAMMVRLSLEHGNIDQSAYAYVLHAMHVGPILGDYEAAYDFGLLAIHLNERFHDLGTRARVLMNFAWNVSLWRKPMEASFPITREAFQLGNDNGLFVEAAYALFNECWFSMLSDTELTTTQRICAENFEYTKRIRMNHFATGGPRVILQWSLALQGLTDHPASLTDSTFDEEEFRHNYYGENLFEMFYFVAKLALLYTFGDYRTASKIAMEAEIVIQNYTGTIWDELTVFYHALTLSALYSEYSAQDQQQVLAKLDAFRSRLKKWAENCPRNFEAQYLIVSGEIAGIQGKVDEQMALYQAAIEAATRHERIRERALANELFAKFWMDKEQVKVAILFLAEARYLYRQWGALAKVKDLDIKYASLLDSAPLRELLLQFEPSGIPSIDQSTTYTRASTLDAATVLKAAQTISSEIILEKFLQTLMKIIIENAGAQKGLLIQEKQGKDWIQAEGSLDQREVRLFDLDPAPTSEKFCPSIVNYVKRTHEILVIGDAENDKRFASDIYVVQNRPKSIMCIPILLQAKLLGVLYLENNLTTNAFTPDRAQVVQTLSSQAAISLENARLYEEMKQEVTQRKQAEEALRLALVEVEKLKNRFQAESVYLQEEIKGEYNFAEIVGSSAVIRKVFRNIERVAGTDSTVLITGETGTGKELVARAVHNRSNRKDSPLIKVNCSALPASLIESELFGHEKGAFTGATARKKGRFELADGGSIFLDEVGELPLETQTKLMRVLQEQEFERVGSAQTLHVNVRVITATNRELGKMVESGAFRSDLFYRINIFPIQLPPLRERREDIPILTNFFISKFSRRMGKKIDRVAAEAMEWLLEYSWPGNVRELANVLERAVILCDTSALQYDHLGVAQQSALGAGQENSTLQEAERLHILRALEKSNWVVGGPNGAAKLLGLNRTTLIARMKKLGIERSND